jgi:hypothetical protein
VRLQLTSAPAWILAGGAVFAFARAASAQETHAALTYAQYADTDHVFVETPSLSGRVADPTAGWRVDAQYLVDVVSAASVDIVSTASRRWQEVRQEGAATAAYKPGTWGGQVEGYVSDEPDYVSWSAGGAVTQDLNDKTVTWQLGYAHGHDVAGRTGTPWSVFSRPLDRDALAGTLTLVVDRATLASFVVDGVLEDGDPSKPYRYVPLFAPGVSVPAGAPVEVVNTLRVSARPLEQLPLSRQRYAITGRLAHRFRGATLRLDLRAYEDSWLMTAVTGDARFLVDVSPRVELGPHARLHGQTAVDFWQRAYKFGPEFQVPALRTGDRELGPLFNATGGWTARFALGSASHPSAWVVRLDLDVTATRYFDDLYVAHRVSALGGVTLEADR